MPSPARKCALVSMVAFAALPATPEAGGRANPDPATAVSPRGEYRSAPVRDALSSPGVAVGPVIYLDASGTGMITHLVSGTIVQQLVTVPIGDSLDIPQPTPPSPPRDTVPARSRIDLRWRA